MKTNKHLYPDNFTMLFLVSFFAEGFIYCLAIQPKLIITLVSEKVRSGVLWTSVFIVHLTSLNIIRQHFF